MPESITVRTTTLLLCILLICIGELPAQAQDKSGAIVHAGHSHNDYRQKRPLRAALNYGYRSVEADIFYSGGRFHVAHIWTGQWRMRSLESLYLKPLKNAVEKKSQPVFAQDKHTFELLIDLKGQWNPERLAALEALLDQYKSLLCRIEDGDYVRGPVRVILTGNMNMAWLDLEEKDRNYFVDGHIKSLGSALDSTIYGRHSGPYGEYFSWQGEGEIPIEDFKTLESLCALARVHDRKLRFWACPEEEAIWQSLMDAGVYWIQVDDLKRFRDFYLKYSAQPGREYPRD